MTGNFNKMHAYGTGRRLDVSSIGIHSFSTLCKVSEQLNKQIKNQFKKKRALDSYQEQFALSQYLAAILISPLHLVP